MYSSTKLFSSSEETAVIPDDGLFNRKVEEEKIEEQPSPNPSIPVYNPPRHLPPLLRPLTSHHQTTMRTLHQWYRVLLQVHRELRLNASDVTTHFLAEPRVYTTVSRYRNITTFLGCLQNVDMVLEYIDGRTLYEVIRRRSTLTRAQKIDFHN